jgi:hypothetical protein
MTDDPERCECGIPLAEHPPLAKPKPLVSWHSARHVSDKYKPAGPVVVPPGWKSRTKKRSST